MHSSTFSTGLRRMAGVLGLAALSLLASSATGHADSDFAAFAEHHISINGSDNRFCGRSHCNGGFDVDGDDRRGSFDCDGIHVEHPGFLTPRPSTPMPKPAHDLAFYRLQARTQGTYFTRGATVDGRSLHGLVFAEGSIVVTGDQIASDATLVCGRGDITLGGSHQTLTPTVDGILAYAAHGHILFTGSGNSYDGALFAPLGEVRHGGTDDCRVSGPIVAWGIRWWGDHGHVGKCCDSASDCSDGNACTADSCGNDGVCAHTPIAGCAACRDDDDCSPADACSTASCNHGICADKAIAGCTLCTKDADCGDHDACSLDTCNAHGVCEHRAQPACIPCDTSADCNDHDACTTDVCAADGTCRSSAMPGCVACRCDGDCDDHDAGTIDTCSDTGICSHTPVEICDDGKDNDGDGLADCQDPDCATAEHCKPAPPKKEICGNCIDDDGDGLTDFEDPDCCPNPMDLHLKKLVIRPNARRNQDRLKLRGLYTKAMPAGFDPLIEDTTVQVADQKGEIFCTTVNAGHFMPTAKHVMQFWGDGSFSNGLTDGRFTVTRHGRVRFRTHGKGAQVRADATRSVRVTVRVGDRCSQETMSLRARKTNLLFP